MEITNLETFGPLLQQLSFGALAGFAAGYALKKVGKVMAIVLGLFFIFLQILAYYGFVRIDWIEVQNRVNPLLGSESLGQLWQRLVNVLTYNIPFAAAFVPMLIIGLRKG
ncbi:MAG: FUN14 domain-containing protein [Trueperaceae bacterium]|nr:FUN14 domain-containing protein [Trueperaceae bacterium]